MMLYTNQKKILSNISESREKSEKLKYFLLKKKVFLHNNIHKCMWHMLCILITFPVIQKTPFISLVALKIPFD